MAYLVTRSEAADEQLKAMEKLAADKPGTAHEVVWDTVRRVLDEVLTVDEFVEDSKKHGSKIKNVFKIPIKRSRLFYIFSSSRKEARVLYYGWQRKEGDKNDAHEVMKRLIRRGTFDTDFEALGVTKPDV